jgi:hypothetical protein
MLIIFCVFNRLLTANGWRQVLQGTTKNIIGFGLSHYHFVGRAPVTLGRQALNYPIILYTNPKWRNILHSIP